MTLSKKFRLKTLLCHYKFCRILGPIIILKAFIKICFLKYYSFTNNPWSDQITIPSWKLIYKRRLLPDWYIYDMGGVAFERQGMDDIYFFRSLLDHAYIFIEAQVIL